MYVLYIAGVVLVLVTRWYLKRRKFNSYLTRYGGPHIPILSMFDDNVNAAAEYMQSMLKWNKMYGPTILIRAGFDAQLWTTDIKIVQHLLSSSTILKKSTLYEFLRSWLGNGLLTSDGAVWKKQRKLITPAFHFQIMEPFIDVFSSQSRVLIKKLEKHVDGPSFDIYNYVTLCALDIICETSMGTMVNAQDNPHSDYVESVKGMATITMSRIFSSLKSVDFLYRFTDDYQKEKSYLKILHSSSESVIVQRREELTKELANGSVFKETNKKVPLLDLLLQSTQEGKSLTNQQIQEQVDTFGFEGHDTISTGLSFTLYCIAKYPKVQDEVVAELQSIFVDDKYRSCTYNDLQEMHYLNMVIKESLRLFPPVLVFGRYLEEDFQLDDHILPKGLNVQVFTYNLHRTEETFPNPEKFDPERFSTTNVQTRSPYSYVPFSAGVRNCVGQRFAMLEMKTVVCEVLRNYELSAIPGEEPVLAFEMLLKSANGIQVQLKKRNF